MTFITLDFEQHYIPEPNSGCWLWLGVPDNYGYGRYGKPSVKAHRLAWELFRGPLSSGLTIDHLCLNKACVNPDHLEPVPNGVNVSRARQFTHCKLGHEFTEANTYWTTDGRRCCKVCRRRRDKERRPR